MKNIDKDTAKVLQAFHQNGSKSFESFSVEENRQSYESNNSARLDSIDLARVTDHSVLTRDNHNINIRIYDPRKQSTLQQSPAIIFIHGGGWVVGSLNTHDTICRFVAHHTNLPVIAIDYRLAPEHPFPTPLNDCLDALQFITSQHDLTIDSHNLAIMGDSAGGNLATIIAHQCNNSTSFTITTEVLFYPVTSVLANTNSYQSIASNYPLSAKTMHWFIEQYITESTNKLDTKLSPIMCEKFNPDIKSFIVTVGLDPLCDEGVEYATKLITQGNFVEFHHLPNTIHGILTSAKSIELGEEYLLRACNFLKNHI